MGFVAVGKSTAICFVSDKERELIFDTRRLGAEVMNFITVRLICHFTAEWCLICTESSKVPAYRKQAR